MRRASDESQKYGWSDVTKVTHLRGDFQRREDGVGGFEYRGKIQGVFYDEPVVKIVCAWWMRRKILSVDPQDEFGAWEWVSKGQIGFIFDPAPELDNLGKEHGLYFALLDGYGLITPLNGALLDPLDAFPPT